MKYPCAIALIALIALIATAPADAARKRPVKKLKDAEPPIVWLAAPEPTPAPEVVIYTPPPQTEGAPPLPPEARDLIEKAIASGDQTQVKAVVTLARDTYPDGGSQINALSAENDARVAQKAALAARERADRLAEASFLDLWKGEIEVGGSRATGNSNTLTLYGGAKLDREGLRWRQKLVARVDYQKSDGTTSVEKINALWQPQYKLKDDLYAYGLAQYDHDRFLGLANRYTAGIGMGYGLVRSTRLKIDVEAGPAYRHTDFIETPDGIVFTDQPKKNTIAGRGSLGFDWKPNGNITFAQRTSVFVESNDSSLVATTSLDTKLFGPLKARLSYDVNYESNPIADAKNLDTVSRAALVYSF